MTANALTPILARKADEVAALKARRADVLARAKDASPARDFLGAIRSGAEAGGAFICEFKRKSPSGGDIRAGAEPGGVARAYQAAGASALSILTDEPAFGGKPADLAAAKAACALPCLRKDFLIDPLQVTEARAMGADAILIILGAVDDTIAADLEAAAESLGMAALAEAHDQSELERALALRTPLIGVNNRDLTRLVTDLGTTERLSALIPTDRILVTESGVRDAADVRRLKRAGAGAYLIGEHLLRQPDIESATRALVSAARGD